MLKALYVKVKGSETRYDEYVSSLQKILIEKCENENRQTDDQYAGEEIAAMIELAEKS